MISCVRSVVRVIAQEICGVVIAVVSVENGSGSESPGLLLQGGPVDGSPIEPGRRSRLEPTELKTVREQGLCELHRRRLIGTAGRNALIADMDDTPQERPRGQHHRSA